MINVPNVALEKRNHRPIGVFDSGLGGLRVLDRLMQTLPDEHFVYLGDTQHMPYGEKTQEQVSAYVTGCLNWLFKAHQVKMVVVACNTAAAVASDQFTLYGNEDVPFVDPVTPICRWLKQENAYRKVGVLATPATVASNRYAILLERLQADLALTQVPCDNLATIIEEGRFDSPECIAMLHQYLQPLKDEAVEALILGCTHYPYVINTIISMVPEMDVLDPAVFMALEARRILSEACLGVSSASSGHSNASEKITTRIAKVDYFVTAEPDRFYETSRRMPFQALAMKKPVVVSTDIPLIRL